MEVVVLIPLLETAAPALDPRAALVLDPEDAVLDP
jgi:hypothetical protein